MAAIGLSLVLESSFHGISIKAKVISSFIANVNDSFVTLESVETPAEGDLSIDYDRQYKSNFRNVEVKLYAKETPLNEPEATENDNKTLEELIQKPTSKTDQALFDAFYPTPAKQHLSEMSLFTQMINKSRSYNFDTTPKLLGTREDLVEILIKSGVGRYLEFKNVDDIYIYDNASKFLEKVPSSKEDVFTNKTVTLIEKRKLMKYLTFAMEFNKEDPILDNTEKMTFTEFLQDKFKISGKLQDAIVYAIALVDKTGKCFYFDCCKMFMYAFSVCGCWVITNA